MKTKLLNSVQLKAVLPAILVAWHEQEYPSILADVARVQLSKKRSQELAFSLVENAAGNWLQIHLKENHGAVASDEDRQMAQKELMKAVYEQYRLITKGRAMSAP